MRKPLIAAFSASIVLLSAAAPLRAHHGTAVFDMSKTLTMKATVTEWAWSNPHCLLQFDVKDENGQVVHWITETQNPANMVNVGLAKTSFQPGDKITVNVTPARNGRPYGRLNQVTLADGRTLDANKGNVAANDYENPEGGSKPGDSSKKP